MTPDFRVAFLGVFLLLAGCVLAPPQPQTPTESLALVYASVEGLAASTRSSLETGRITREQAENNLAALESVMEVAQQAEFLLTIDRPEDAVSVLSTVSAILVRIEESLR